MPRPVRVLFDVTQFGVAHANRHDAFHRAGVHRVLEQAVRSLSATPDVALALCSREDPDSALAFLEEDPDLRHVPFRPARKRVARRLSARIRENYDRHGAHPPGSLPTRLSNKLAVVANQLLDPRTSGLGVTTFVRADVYHSPIYALPGPGERARNLRYFLTIYDVIPFLLPEFSVGWGGEAWLRRIIASLGPDDHVFAISEHTRNDLLNACPQIAPERVHVTPLAANPERFYPVFDADRAAEVRARYGVPNAPYVLSVGTLEPRKNVPHLIRTFAELVRAEQLDDLHLVLTGARGWDYEAVAAAAGGMHDVQRRIIFTDYVDDRDLAPLYSGALVFAYPSYYEGFGLPPLEAMQCGTPVITGNTSSFPEVVGDAGVMVDPRDGAALAQAILELYRDPSRRAGLAERGLARARSFTWENFAQRTVAAYRAAL